MSESIDQPTTPPGWYTEPATGSVRWWDGTKWGQYQQPPMTVAHVAASQPAQNGLAIAALVLGVWGFLTTWLPFFVGIFLGVVPDILAIIFGISGIVRANSIGGRGMPLAIVGLVLGGLAFLSVFVGAGWLW